MEVSQHSHQAADSVQGRPQEHPPAPFPLGCDCAGFEHLCVASKLNKGQGVRRPPSPGCAVQVEVGDRVEVGEGKGASMWFRRHHQVITHAHLSTRGEGCTCRSPYIAGPRTCESFVPRLWAQGNLSIWNVPLEKKKQNHNLDNAHSRLLHEATATPTYHPPLWGLQ